MLRKLFEPERRKLIAIEETEREREIASRREAERFANADRCIDRTRCIVAEIRAEHAAGTH